MRLDLSSFRYAWLIQKADLPNYVAPIRTSGRQSLQALGMGMDQNQTARSLLLIELLRVHPTVLASNVFRPLRCQREICFCLDAVGFDVCLKQSFLN